MMIPGKDDSISACRFPADIDFMAQKQCVCQVLTAPADLAVVPAGREAGASCSPGCRALDSAPEAAHIPLRDPALQPARAFNRATNTGSG